MNRLVRAVFLGGLSTRRVGTALAPLLGDTVSPTTVSKITQALDHAVAAFHARRLADHYRYLFLDAVALGVKTPDGTRRRHALVAYGRTATGQRELIDYRPSAKSVRPPGSPSSSISPAAASPTHRSA